MHRTIVALIFLATAASAQNSPVGYSDTPVIPGQKWKVHDIDRVHPRQVTPGTEGRPPSDAVVLFDGKDLSKWDGVKDGKKVPAAWKVENGYMEVVPGAGILSSKDKFGTAQYHVEWTSPTEIKGNSQGRGNSGFFLMDKYEIQVLDSWNNLTYADGQASAIYGQWPPLVNAARKPGEWQTYDIIFEAPKFEGQSRQAGLRDGAAQRRGDASPSGAHRANHPPPNWQVRGAWAGRADFAAGSRRQSALPEYLGAPHRRLRSAVGRLHSAASTAAKRRPLERRLSETAEKRLQRNSVSTRM